MGKAQKNGQVCKMVANLTYKSGIKLLFLSLNKAWLYFNEYYKQEKRAVHASVWDNEYA